MIKKYAVDARTYDRRFPGIGRYVSSLLREAVEHLNDDEQILYLCSREQKSALRLPDTGKSGWIEATASPFGLIQQWEIPLLLHRHRATVYHSPYYLMPYMTAIPTVLTVYDFIPQLFPEHVSARARWLFRFATKFALWRAAQVIAISEATRQDLHSNFRIDSSFTTTIPLAPAPQFRPIDVQRVERFKSRYALEQGYVLHVGSRKTHKNVTGLIKAWALVSEPARRGRVLVLAGHWHSRSSYIEQEIASNQLGDRVRLLAGVEESELAALYSGADLFVFPSYYEGFGLPVLEAMACGCPVACSNRSSIPEVTADAALLFDPEAPSSIAAAIEEMLLDSELRRGYRRKSLRRAAEFSWTNTAIQTLSIYRQLAELYPACTPQL